MKKKILLVYTNFTSFVKGDYDILSTTHDVTLSRFRLNHPRQVPFSLLLQCFRLLFTLHRYDKVYIWFGDYHSFLPVLFARLYRKPCYLVVGGYDVCRMRDLKYGSFKNPVRGFMTRFSMCHCTRNLTVSHFVHRRVKAITHRDNATLIFNGTNIKQESVQATDKRDIVLTVATIPSEQVYLRKGIDRFIEAAMNLPEYRFILVGISPKIDYMYAMKPDNMEVYDRLPQNDLVRFYREAKVYCQLSRMDTFCMTLAEGMLYNCVPVITRVGGMPEVVGDTGFILHEEDQRGIESAIREAMQCPYSTRYRQRIEEHFLLSIRQERLLAFLAE